MNAPNPAGLAILDAPNKPALFASVRSSRDVTLVAFAGALLAAFALQAGAFLPRLSAPESTARPAAIEAVPEAPAPAVVARGASAAPSHPCVAPHG